MSVRNLSELKDSVEKIRAGLKRFQLETVDHVIDLFDHGVGRVLVADEVGLGKTLVAKGIIAELAYQKLSRGADRFKVIYICSNASIVNQNLEKLAVDGFQTEPIDSKNARLSSQHLRIYQRTISPDAKSADIQLVPLTPGTSFYRGSAGGLKEERALIYAILSHLERFASKTDKLSEILRLDVKPVNWEKQIGRALEQADEGYLEWIEPQFNERDRLDALSELDKYLDAGAHDEKENLKRVSALRELFSDISLENLGADLVIMDEFQRFRYLIESDDPDTKELVDKLLNQNNGMEEVPVLLLSATPFIPYSTATEDEFLDETSATDFLRVIGSLSREDGKPEETKFGILWRDYGKKLSQFVISHEELDGVIKKKEEAEKALRSHMARTERNRLKEYADIIHDCSDEESIIPTSEDVETEIVARQFLRRFNLESSFPFEYAESCPYMYSYMTDYKVLKDLKTAITTAHHKMKFQNEDAFIPKHLWLRTNEIKKFKKLNFYNTRFQRLQEDVFKDEMSTMLWIPASRPYYRTTSGPYKKASKDRFGKRLSKTIVFSSWRMVPKMMATLLSYEDERSSIEKLGKGVANYMYFDKVMEPNDTEESNQNWSLLPSGRLKLREGQRITNGASRILLPSDWLANSVEWRDRDDGRLVTDKELTKQVASALEREFSAAISSDGITLDSFIAAGGNSNADYDWYMKVALYMDSRVSDSDSQLGRLLDEFEEGVAQKWKLDNREDFLCKEWQRVRNKSWGKMGPRPKDLFEQLAKTAIASPAVCALRVFNGREHNGREKDRLPTTLLALRFALAFRNKMNTAASTLAVDAAIERKSSRQSHWIRVLEYCLAGNLQAVLDEYAYVLGPGRTAESLCETMVGPKIGNQPGGSLYTLQSKYKVEHLKQVRRDCNLVKNNSYDKITMRADFALSLTDDDSEQKSQYQSNVRAAFNSPFRPFVLCSTSIGQEGLDFHSYCRKIVHWNIPHNPIELEQREGRINRFGCLAIRQNLAKRYGHLLGDNGNDLWKSIYDMAERDIRRRHGEEELAGIAPYWGLDSYEEDDVRIERHTYLLKFSKDEQRYRQLKRLLVSYRAVMGQPRQEELLEKLSARTDGDGEELKELFLDLAPFNHRGEPWFDDDPD